MTAQSLCRHRKAGYFLTKIILRAAQKFPTSFLPHLTVRFGSSHDWTSTFVIISLSSGISQVTTAFGVSLSCLDRRPVDLGVPLLLLVALIGNLVLGLKLDFSFKLPRLWRSARAHTLPVSWGEALTALLQLFLRPSFGDMGRVSGSCPSQE